jgi:hypothetical protein
MFLGLTPYSLLKISRRFGKTCSPPSSGSQYKRNKILTALLHAAFCYGLFVDP